MFGTCILLFCAGALASLVATPLVIRLAKAVDAADRPDQVRKTHRRPTPTLGGLAVAAALLLALAGTSFVASALPQQLVSDGLVHPWTLAALVLVLGLGAADDLWGLRPTVKLAGQTAAAGLLFTAGLQIQRLFLFGTTHELGNWALLATLCWFLGCMNIWNLIDGMDGLASGLGALVALTFVVAAQHLGHPGVAAAAAALAGALAGFLAFNYHPARIFLGDTGSLFLGTMLGILAIRGSLKSGMTVALLGPMLAMGLPICDSAAAVLRRWLGRLPLCTADRFHVHHRLQARGWSPPRVSLTLYGLTALLCAAALVSILAQSAWLALLAALPGLAGLLIVADVPFRGPRGLGPRLRSRLGERRRRRRAARIVCMALARLADCRTVRKAVRVTEALAQDLDCDGLALRWSRDGVMLLEHCVGVFTLPRQTVYSFRDAGAGGHELYLELRQYGLREVPLGTAATFLEDFHAELLLRLAPMGPAACRGGRHTPAPSRRRPRRQRAARSMA